jgi:hypothetical protein
MNSPQLTFDVWKAQFSKDCERQGKLFAYNSLGEFCLKVLWESGLEPSVKAISKEDEKNRIA